MALLFNSVASPWLQQFQMQRHAISRVKSRATLTSADKLLTERDLASDEKAQVLADLIWMVADVNHIGGTPT